MLNPHSILGIPTNATPAEIKAAYRRLASQLHPDRNPGNLQAEEQLKDVNRAYRALCVNGAFCEPAPRANDFFSFIDRMADAFRNVMPESLEIPLSFEEALSGVIKHAELFRHQPCRGCSHKAPRERAQCSVCRGEGRQTVGDEVFFHFPQGVAEGETVTATSKLGITMVASVGMTAHPIWTRDGNDLSMSLPLAPEDLWAGHPLIILTPYGRLEYRLPAGCSLSTPLRFAHQGVRRADGVRGHLWVSLEPEIPNADGVCVRKQARKKQEEQWSPIQLQDVASV